MSNQTRKRTWPVSLAAVIGVVVMLAMLSATMWGAGSAQAQVTTPPPPATEPTNLQATAVSATEINLTWGRALGAARYEIQRKTGSGTYSTIAAMNVPRSYSDTGLTASTMYTYQVRGVNDGGSGLWSTETPATTLAAGTTSGTPSGTASASTMVSSSNSSGAAVQLTLTIGAADMETLSAGDRIEIYLENDYGVPDSISTSDVYFRVPGGDISVNGGGRVNAADVEVGDGDHFGNGDDDWAIAILVPDMDPRDDSFGYPSASAALNVVIAVGAGVKNGTEEGDHSVGYSILTGTEGDNDGPEVFGASIGTDSDGIVGTSTMRTQAKVSLSDEDNTRGYELTVTGSGFNNGTTADVWVLNATAEPTSCELLIGAAGASKAGSALVGTEDKAVVTFEVTVPTFRAGPNNHVCMVDGESRHSSDVDQFELEPSIRVVPSTASSGDIINIFAQDFPTDSGTALDYIEISDQVITMSGPSLNSDGSATVSLEIPGQLPDGTPLQGTVRVDASWGGKSKNSKITVTGSELSVSESDVLPNETITITGNGYGSQTCIPVSAITLDNVPMMVDAESAGSCTDTGGDNNPDNDITFSNAVEVSNAGQFVATITLWSPGTSNPTLIAGIHTLSVEDSKGFTGDRTMAIPEPTVTITPDVVGPRDYLVVTGENWPMDNPDNPLTVAVTVEIDDYGTGRTYPLYADNSGRFTVEHRVNRNVAIPSTNQVTATYESVVKVGSFSVPAATVTVTPSVAQPGDLISISATDMPVYTAAEQVKIGGTEFNDPGVNTDRDGNITIDDLLVPGLDPGTYSVLLKIHDTIAIGEIEVVAEDSAAGPGAMLPDALTDLGTTLVRVFHFNGVDKSWDFYDPRADFADLNTLTTLVNGEPYWILVSEGQDGALLNNRARTLTCVGGDCWNQLVW